jgi:hypothetical protein
LSCLVSSFSCVRYNCLFSRGEGAIAHTIRRTSEEDNDSYNHAKSELERFERFKKVRYLPTLKFDRCLSAVNENGVDVEIGVGPIEKRGENLPSGKNIADYLDKKGQMNLLTFFKDHEIRFPTLFVIVQREVSRRVVEVGCEKFFGLSGYISQPRRSMWV